MGLLSDDTMRTAADRFVRELQNPPAESGAGGTPGSALRSMFRRVTREQMTAFLTGLGLNSLRDLTLTLSGDAERMGLAMDLTIDDEPGMIRDYLAGVRERQLVAWRLLPADTLMAIDSIVDAPRLWRLLHEHARDTLGPSGETVFPGLSWLPRPAWVCRSPTRSCPSLAPNGAWLFCPAFRTNRSDWWVFASPRIPRCWRRCWSGSPRACR